MKITIHSYRFAEEIVQHPNHQNAWEEIRGILQGAPLFVYPNKSSSNPKLEIVQQVMNTYFDRVMSIDNNWEYHPLATRIANSGLKADFRKAFGDLVVQAEVQFGNMSRWYSDIFKFQTAYSQALINIGLSIVPMSSMARRIDSNIVNYERTERELPSAKLSITLPILLIGLEEDSETTIVDISKCRFASIREITGKGKTDNRWRIVNGYIQGKDMSEIGPESPTGPKLDDPDETEE